MSNVKRGIDRGKSSAFPVESTDTAPISEDRRSNKERRRNGYISHHPFFNDVTYSELEPLVDLCDKLSIETGDILLEPDQENDHLFLLLDGQLKVHIDKADSEEGFLIEAGECMGEISIIDGELTTAYVIAQMPCRVLAIPKNLLWNGFFKIPAVARNFMRLSAQRFRDRNRAMQTALEQQLRMEHLQKELAIAHQIQASMLPTDDSLWKRHPRLDLYAKMTPANEVGGDFFDIFPVDDKRVCLAIGDVSGKGIPAALFMVRTMTLLREEILRHSDLSTAIGRLNVKLCQDNPQCMFVTLIAGIFDIDKRCFSYVNAGHNRPIFGSGSKTFNFLDPTGDIIVGISEMAVFNSTEQHLSKDDILVLYTDGITEAMNNKKELFSDDRLQRLLSNTETGDAKQTVDTIESAVQMFANGAPQSDDLTMLVVHYRAS